MSQIASSATDSTPQLFNTSFILYALFDAGHAFVGIELCPKAPNPDASKFCNRMFEDFPQTATFRVENGNFVFDRTKAGYPLLYIPDVTDQSYAQQFNELLRRDKLDPSFMHVHRGRKYPTSFAVSIQKAVVAHYVPINGVEP
ncbi:MAG TPA: hypothetical protein VF438_03730 [Candidatus Paceibacterota bacterium]